MQKTKKSSFVPLSVFVFLWNVNWSSKPWICSAFLKIGDFTIMLLQYTISNFYWLYTDEGTGNYTNTKISLFRSLFQEQSSLDRLITTIIRCVMMKIKIKMMTIIRWHLVMMELMTLISIRRKFPKHPMTGRQDPMIMIMIEWKDMTMINELIFLKITW